jgi:2-phospho-L-lactate guanylyltransferase
VSCAAIIAVKGTAAAKSRLRDTLSSRRHDVLVEAMLRHVSKAAGGARRVAEVLMVSPAQRSGDWPRTIIDTATDLNAAFDLGTHAARKEGHSAALLLPADLATITSADLDEFIRLGEAAGVALASDRAGTGTNAIWMPLAQPLRLSFGAGSFASHRQDCVRMSVAPAAVNWPTLALDIDYPADLEHLRGMDDYELLWSSERSVA